MQKKTRNALILSAKILLSAALLWWVLGHVSWNDFVLRADGRSAMPVRDVHVGGDGTLTLVRPDRTRETVAARTLTPVDPDAPATPENYRRPGFLSVVRGISLPLLGVSAGLSLVQLFIMGYRWWRLLAVQDIRIPYREVLRLTWLGTFFNYIVLGTTGGDVVKAYYASRHTTRKTECLVTVFIDRLVGLIGLTLLSTVMLGIVAAARALGAGAYFAGDDGKLVIAATVAGGVTAGLAALGVVVFSRRLRRALRLNRLYRRLPMRDQIVRAGDALGLYRHHLSALARAMGHTLTVHLMFVIAIALAGASLGLAIPWYQYVIYIPLIYIIAAVPIVPGGVGLAESFYVTFFLTWANHSQILALALLARLIPMFWALPGVLVAITGPKLPPGEQIRAELDAAQAGLPAEDAGPRAVDAEPPRA